MTSFAHHSARWLVTAAATVLTAGISTAQTVSPSATTGAPSDSPPPGYWIDGIHLSAQLEGGITFNPSAPKENFGQLFTDRANQPILN